MKQRALLLMFAITTVMMLAAPALRAAVPFVIPIVATDDSGNTRTLAIGILTTASACIDTTDQFSGYQEYELPPVPPTNVFDARLDDRSGVPNTPCYGQGSATDFRPEVTVGQIDTFLVKTQDGTGGRPIHLSWPAGLNSVATSCVILDQFGGFLINVDMLTSTNYDLTSGLPSSFYIILAPIIAPNTPVYFTSLTPDQVFNEGVVPGKSAKPIKRFKGLGMPNFSNLLDETVAQGGFQSGSSESDVAGGMVVGTGQMDNVGGKYKPNKAYAALRRWARLSKWDAVKLKGKSFGDIQKSLKDKTGSHIGIARGFDSTGNPGDLKRKLLVKQKALKPKEQSNRLYAELVATKVNIAASALGKTPAGFGELLYVRPGHPYDGLAITEITDRLDSVMTFWEMIGPNGGGEWDSAYNALFEINRAFDAPSLDTLSWETGGKDSAKLVVKGNVDVNTISYLALPPAPFTPTRIVATNNDWESGEDFEDQDENEIDGVPAAMKLYQNYPNPFNPSTTIAFRLGTASNVSIKIFDVLGREVATVLENEEMEEGVQTVEFSASTLSSGVYFYRVEGQNVDGGERIQPAVGKMMLLK